MTETLPEIPAFPMARARECPLDPPPELARLRTGPPVVRVRIWDGSTPWLITGHADQVAVLTDPRFSADARRPGYPHVAEGAVARSSTTSFMQMDDPEHARLRRMVTAEFAIKRVEAMRPRIQHLVDELVDGMLAGGPLVDLVEAIALPLPSLVICELLGVPYTDHEFFQTNSRVLVSRSAKPEEVVEANRRLTSYLGELADAETKAPREGLLSRLAAEEYRPGTINRGELAELALLLLAGGHETTANMIALGTVALIEHPHQAAALREGDPDLVAGAVDELLRYLTVTHSGRRRVATEDVELGGELIRAGEGVIVANDLGNRDEKVFPNPDRLDIHRNAKRHLAFGFGVHQCLGQSLVRVELQIVFSTLFRRVPTLATAVASHELPFKWNGLIYGLTKLPVTW